MKKLTLKNSFHGTETTVFASPGDTPHELDCQNDKNAKRKLKKIEKALCGMTDCKCGILR